MVNVEIKQFCEYAQKIAVYKDGDLCEYTDGESLNKISAAWGELLKGSYEMPAFGVSLNDETLSAMQSGVWAEFVYDGCYTHDGMPFERLLIEVNESFRGFNIIRYNTDGGYCGRCFYVNLQDGTMSDFYRVLCDL